MLLNILNWASQNTGDAVNRILFITNMAIFNGKKVKKNRNSALLIDKEDYILSPHSAVSSTHRHSGPFQAYRA